MSTHSKSRGFGNHCCPIDNINMGVRIESGRRQWFSWLVAGVSLVLVVDPFGVSTDNLTFIATVAVVVTRGRYREEHQPAGLTPD